MSWMISQKCFKEFITLYNEMVYIESCCLGMQGDTHREPLSPQGAFWNCVQSCWLLLSLGQCPVHSSQLSNKELSSLWMAVPQCMDNILFGKLLHLRPADRKMLTEEGTNRSAQ